ncbi:MAG TPA: V-type ATPase 116kDa subunit family protein, partial [Spirochaetota bacterium]|nr:V-type ATPase 116kDa subunit family protein [Spirochaetota bacterium]
PTEFFIKSKKPFKIGIIADWLMDWIVELLELFSGYLSNTLSFLRIAGLGIAHVSLMNAFFQIAASSDSALVSLFVIIIGNILVIALEGLSAGIQSLRLNYYEFFSKYFRGSGKVYEPISLRQK